MFSTFFHVYVKFKQNDNSVTAYSDEIPDISVIGKDNEQAYETFLDSYRVYDNFLDLNDKMKIDDLIFYSEDEHIIPRLFYHFDIYHADVHDISKCAVRQFLGSSFNDAVKQWYYSSFNKSLKSEPLKYRRNRYYYNDKSFYTK